MKEKGSVAKDAWGVIGSAFVLHLSCPFHVLTAYVKQTWSTGSDDRDGAAAGKGGA